jgi:hypothetical protein
MGWNLEVEIAQDLGPQAIAQSDIFEPNQVSAPFASGLARTRQNGSRDAGKHRCRRYGFRFVNAHFVPSVWLGPAVRRHCDPCSTNFRNKAAPAVGGE